MYVRGIVDAEGTVATDRQVIGQAVVGLFRSRVLVGVGGGRRSVAPVKLALMSLRSFLTR